MDYDMFKQMCVRRGYVPEMCILPGQMVWALVNSQGNPCIGCNADRSVCKTQNRTK